jgi:hypothetical protein
MFYIIINNIRIMTCDVKSGPSQFIIQLFFKPHSIISIVNSRTALNITLCDLLLANFLFFNPKLYSLVVDIIVQDVIPSFQDVSRLKLRKSSDGYQM